MFDGTPQFIRGGRRLGCAGGHAGNDSPAVTQSMDLVYSDLMIQWRHNPQGVLWECLWVLRPGSQLRVVKTFGGARPPLHPIKQRYQNCPQQPGEGIVASYHGAGWNGENRC